MKKLFFYFVFAILILGRLAVLSTGFLDDSDEVVYYFTIENLKELLTFNMAYWSKATFHLDYFASEVFLRTYQMLFIVPIAEFLDLPLNHFSVVQLFGFFNIIASFISIFIIYKTLSYFKLNFWAILLGILVYGTFINTNLYVRHFLPYENSFCLHLIAFYLLLTKEKTIKNLFISGFVFALAFTSYFGYFMFLFINIALLFWLLNKEKYQLKKIFYKGFVFLLPLSIFALIFQLVAHLALDKSYFHKVLNFSTTIYHGSYDEGLIYPFLYFKFVEGYWGLLWLSISIIGLLFLFFKSNYNTNLKAIAAIFLFAYLGYGINSVFFEGMVFYGRVFRMYYFLLTIGIVCALDSILRIIDINLNALKKPLIIAFGFVIFISASTIYFLNLQELNSLGYPRSEIYKNQFYPTWDKEVVVSHEYELDCSDLVYDPSSRFVSGSGKTKLTKGNYRLLNFCFLNHIEDFMDRYSPIEYDDSKVIFKKKHFMSHPAYTFEYCTREGRNFFLENNINLVVLKN